MLLVKEPLVLRQAPKGQEEEVGRRLAPPSVMDHMVRSTETLPSSIPGDRTSVRHEQGKKKRKIYDEGGAVCTFFVLLSFSVVWLIRSVLCKSTVLNEGIKKNLGEMEREGEDSLSLHREEGRMKSGGGGVVVAGTLG